MKDKNIVSFKVHPTARYTYIFDVNAGTIARKDSKTTISIYDIPVAKGKYKVGYAENAPLTHLQRLVCQLFEGEIDIAIFLDLCNVADKLDSIDFKARCRGVLTRDYLYTIRNTDFAIFAKWARTERAATTNYSIADYKDYFALQEFKRKYPAYMKKYLITDEFISRNYYDFLTHNLVVKNLDLALYYLLGQKLHDFVRSFYYDLTMAGRLLIHYFNMCEVMNKPVEKSNNFMREYIETNHAYELWKKQHDKEIFTRHYVARNKALTFTHGDFTIVLPQEPQDLITEGNEMHHCVGSYIDKVIEGECLIVFVRHKDAPNQCYITAQIMPNGDINQYYLAYDKSIRKTTDIDFKLAFQKHLREHWNDGGNI